MERKEQISVRSFIEELENLFLEQNACEITQILSRALNEELSVEGLENFDKCLAADESEADVQRQLQIIFENYLQNFVEALKAREEKREEVFRSTFADQTTQQLVRAMEDCPFEEQQAWFTDLIKFHAKAIVSNFIREYSRLSFKEETHLETTIINKLRSFLRMTHRGVVKMRLKILFLVLSLRIGFFLQNYKLSHETLSSERDDIANHLSNYPKSEEIFFLYYTGRIDIFASHFAFAQKEFGDALGMCRAVNRSQRREILKYLIPVNMFFGRFPTKKLLEDHRLFEYAVVAESVIKGDLAAFARHQEQYKMLWIRRGLFLAMDKLKLIAIRNLFKRVWRLWLEKEANETKKDHNIPLEYFQKALNFSSKQEHDKLEVACILGNLFLMQLIKGEIHQANLVVLKPNGAFMPIANCIDHLKDDLVA